MAAAHKIEDTDEVLQAKLKEIRQYAVVPEQYSDKLVLQAKFGVAVEKWMEANEIDAVAIQLLGLFGTKLRLCGLCDYEYVE